MDFRFNTDFDIMDHCGNIVLLYLEEDREGVSALKKALDDSGYLYECREIGKNIIGHRDYAEDTERAMRSCSCLVVVVSNSFKKEENTFYRGVFWYTVGYMRSGSQEAVVPISVSGKDISLAGTPLQGVDMIYSETELMDTIEERFSGKLMCNNYYDDPDINTYASKRIRYRCFKLRFKIYETAFQNAKQFYREYSSRRVTDSAFDAYIVENLICGCRVVSFGAEELLIPPMEPYRTEIKSCVADYPKVNVGKNIYSLKTEEEREETGIRAEISIDVSVPVHKILGTCFKSYIDCRDSDCPVYFLLALLEGDFTEKEPVDYEGELPEDPEYWYGIYPEQTYIDERTERLYFTVGLRNSDKDIRPDPSAGIGEYTDYIYPQ